jgi:hypothetical protein
MKISPCSKALILCRESSYRTRCVTRFSTKNKRSRAPGGIGLDFVDLELSFFFPPEECGSTCFRASKDVTASLADSGLLELCPVGRFQQRAVSDLQISFS